MSLPSVLNIALGLFFVYLLLSLLVSDLQEFLSTFFWDSRAKSLKGSIASILGDKMTESLYNHPLIQSLKDYKIGQGDQFFGPSYIPQSIFAAALIDLIVEQSSVELNLLELQSKQFIDLLNLSQIQALLSPETIKLFKVLAVRAALKQDEFKTYLEALEAEIMNWFSQTMERASGVYKRQVKWKILGLGFLLAVILNADTLNIATRLYKEPFLQIQLIQTLDGFYDRQIFSSIDQSLDLSEPQKSSENLAQYFNEFILDWSSLPLGWTKSNLNEQFSLLRSGYQQEGVMKRGQISLEIAQVLLGWILTAIAISMGATFWFDILKKLINVRNTGNDRP